MGKTFRVDLSEVVSTDPVYCEDLDTGFQCFHLPIEADYCNYYRIFLDTHIEYRRMKCTKCKANSK